MSMLITFQSLRKAEGFTEKQEHLVKIHDQTIKNLQQEIAVCATQLFLCMYNQTHCVVELQRRGEETA